MAGVYNSFHIADLWIAGSTKEVCIVHDLWLLDDGLACLWPPASMKVTSHVKLQKLLRLNTKPSSIWIRYFCKVRKSFETLENAELFFNSRNVELSEQSAAEETENIPLKRARRPTERYSPTLSSNEPSSASGSEDEAEAASKSAASSINRNYSARHYLQLPNIPMPSAPSIISGLSPSLEALTGVINGSVESTSSRATRKNMDQTQPQQTQSSLFAGMPLRDKSLGHVANPSANPVRHNKRSKLTAHECPPPLMRPSHNPATNRNPAANRNPSVPQPVFGPTAPLTVSVPSPVQVSSLFQRPSSNRGDQFQSVLINMLTKQQTQIDVLILNQQASSADATIDQMPEWLPINDYMQFQRFNRTLAFTPGVENKVRDKLLAYFNFIHGKTAANMMTRCMGALFTNSMAGDLNWKGLAREGVAKGKFGGSESQILIHLAVNRRFPQASKFEMEKDSKDFLRHAPARVKQDAARAEKEEAAMVAHAAGVAAGARHPLDHSYDNVESNNY